MTPPLGECPTPDELARFIDRRADTTLRFGVLAHVDGCELCRELLAIAVRSSSPVAPTAPGATICTFPVGTIVDDRYQIVRFIARGGMGEVYEARDSQLDESIALKTISSVGLDNARLYARLRREVQLARKVTHPNVCRILEFGLHRNISQGQQEHIPYLTMELLEGVTLAKYAQKCGGLHRKEFLEVTSQLVEGLDAVHRCGIVHRDLKPQNVIVTGELNDATPRVVLTDFGLATVRDLKAVSESSFEGMAAGTPAYMPPEQMKGESPSPLWDIYALGLVMYQLAAGRLPFGDQSPAQAALAKARGRPTHLSSVVAGFDAQLAEIVARCLARRPSRRYQSAADIRLALQRAATGIDVSLRRRRLRYTSVAAIAVAATWIGWALYPDLRMPESATPHGGEVSASVSAPKSQVSNDLVESRSTVGMSGTSLTPTSTRSTPQSSAARQLPVAAAARINPQAEPRSPHSQVGTSLPILKRGHTADVVDDTPASSLRSSHSQASDTQVGRNADAAAASALTADGLITPKFARLRSDHVTSKRGD